MIQLPQGTPLDYLKSIRWGRGLAQDRFFAYCDPQFGAGRTAAAHGEFAAEIGPDFFHPGARQLEAVQFGEAMCSSLFHESDTALIAAFHASRRTGYRLLQGRPCHALLEAFPNALTGGLTNPDIVYVLPGSPVASRQP